MFLSKDQQLFIQLFDSFENIFYGYAITCLPNYFLNVNTNACPENVIENKRKTLNI